MEDIDEEIEYNFTPSQFVKDFPTKTACSTYMEQFKEGTKLARDLFDNTLDIQYDSQSECKLDLYRCKDTADSAPVFIFIHGGYWQMCSKDDHGIVVFPVMEANANAAVVDYQLAPHASLDDILSQICSSIEFISKKFLNSKLYLCGHSAGAQLAAMILTLSHCQDTNLSKHISGMLLLSGVFDLIPLLKTSVNIPLKMDKDVATRNSPLLLLREQKPAFICPVVVVNAELDPPRFKEQSQNFCKVLENHGIATKYLDIPNTDHFSLITKLQTNTKYHLSQEIIAMIME